MPEVTTGVVPVPVVITGVVPVPSVTVPVVGAGVVVGAISHQVPVNPGRQQHSRQLQDPPFSHSIPSGQ